MNKSGFEQKYCMGTKDGKTRIFWDITALLDDLQFYNGTWPIYKKSVTRLTEKNNFSGDPVYAEETDVFKPCIIIELCEGAEKLIDGNHRLYKAARLKLKEIPCYILPFKYHKKFIINYDEDIYKKVIADNIEN